MSKYTDTKKYTSSYNIKDFALNVIGPKYFPEDVIEGYNIGLLGYTLDLFANTTEDIFNINSMLADVIYKYYTVKHEPQIELPFEAEYEYIKNKVNRSLAGNKKLNNFTHIFISGYLPNGKTIHYNGLG